MCCPFTSPLPFVAVVCSPNPFSSVTRLSFGVPTKGAAVFEMFDATGRVVVTRDLEPVESGVQWINFDGRDDAGRLLPAGVWFVRLRTSAGMGRTVRLVRVP